MEFAKNTIADYYKPQRREGAKRYLQKIITTEGSEGSEGFSYTGK